MKKQLLSALILVAAATTTQAQVVHDSVILDAGYAKQVWYSLQNDEQGSAQKNEWDIAFDVVEITSSIRINSAAGVMLWNYPKGDKSAWSTVDTNGLSTWDPRYNSDTSWAQGAMGRYADPNNPFDIDWGIYDMTTHIIHGDSVYIIKLVNGNYKKLFIDNLTGGTFNFKFANLDGSSEVSAQVSKSTFTDKNLGYYSIVNQNTLNREPDNFKWDLEFTQYTGFVPIPYTVTGVLHNRGVSVAEVGNLPNKNTYSNWQSHTRSTEINTIGYDWKSQSMGVYSVKDSLLYFVKDVEDHIWRLIFTDFSSTNGMFVFDKEVIGSLSVKDNISGNKNTVALYPNPSKGGDVQLVYSTPDNVTITVTDMAGRTVFAQQVNGSTGLHTFTLPANSFNSGMYIVAVNTAGGCAQQKLIVQ
ncbi:MAG: T9SS type A sorting domain-containing protein [Chitinophagales bacterium]|nr:T9SS type A sorting domain-containing protein [Chitinophagales bacterium]